MRRNVLLVTTLAGALLLAGGCGSGGTKTSASASAAAGTPVTDKGDGYALTLPPGYRYITDPAKSADLLSAEDAKSYPDLASQVRDAFAQNAKLMAVRSTGPAMSGINVIVTPAGPLSPESLAQPATRKRIADQLASVGMQDIETSAVTIDGTNGLRVDYHLKAGGRTISGVQLYAAPGKTLYTTTLSYQGAEEAPAAEVDLVARTLRVN
jgi:hypothetical protein